MKNNLDVFNMHGCVVKDEKGVVRARLFENDGVLIVKKMPSCSVGTYFSILSYLIDMGFDVK